jgi:hypothetical protein
MSSQDAQIAEQLNFDFLPQREVVVQPHAGQITSDAGLLPIAQFDRRWNYTARMAECLRDDTPVQEPPKPHKPLAKPLTQHQRIEMLRQRLFGILAGYEDCNDHDTLRSEPVFKMVADRLPEDDDLASQPTLSRFENAVSVASLFRLNDFLIATGIERLKRMHGGTLPASLTIDLDPTDDPTHGQQQLTLFHGYFGQYQYFPLVISEPTTKHVFGVWLRHGTAHAALGAEDDLMRVVDALRKARPDIQIHVRGDAAFGVPWMYEVCETNDLTYTFGFSTNARLKASTESLMDQAVRQYEQSKDKQRLFDCFAYQCDSWDRSRTVVAKAECHAQGTNLRFVVTNRPGVTCALDGQREYDDYIQRGESEQRMDELKNGLKMDRLSCHRFMANFFRLLLHAAAFNLLNALRQSEELPEVLRVGQPCTWRTHVIKVAATIVQTTRRIIVKLAANWPWWRLYHNVGRRALACSELLVCGP